MKWKKRHQNRGVSPALQVGAVPVKRCRGVQDITRGEHNAGNCTIEFANFRKIEIYTIIKVNMGHWEECTIAVADTVLSNFPSEKKMNLELGNIHAHF